MTMKIYLVEDDAVIAGHVARHLEAWGYQVKTAEDFRNILGEFQAFQPQLVLLDIALPFFNGYHWCTELRKVSRVPIIFLSSVSDNMNIVTAMDLGGDDFVPKPFDLSVLSAKVRSTLRRCYDFAAPQPVLAHRGGGAGHGGRLPPLSGGEAGPQPQRVPHFAGAAGAEGPHRLPGRPDAEALGDGQLRG